jgi:hypothetical protein
MTLNLDNLESKAKAAGGDEWFASVIGLRVNATNAKIGGETPICDIRGWGYLTGQGHGALGLSEKEAIAVQRAIADYIASANPATMLALVAHIRKLAADKERYRDLAERNAERAALLANDGHAVTLIRRLVAERAKLVEAARPFAYLIEGDLYPTEREVERLRAAIEGVDRE